MGKKLTQVEFYIGILVVFGILSLGVTYLGAEIVTNDNSNLDNDSISYIANLNGIDLNDYSLSKSELEISTILNPNGTAATSKDDALDFLFAKQKGFDIELIIKRVFNIPSYLLIDLLRLPFNDWAWILNIITWMLWIFITIAIIYFLRNR